MKLFLGCILMQIKKNIFERFNEENNHFNPSDIDTVLNNLQTLSVPWFIFKIKGRHIRSEKSKIFFSHKSIVNIFKNMPTKF